ncbi:MAG: response regulator [Candidatus Buchananbacteria bacterium]|nr:response regulator [Candidatus Buchananbacteria bacterium]
MAIKKEANTTILLVEDDEFLSELYATKLKLEGYNVVLANDGEKGLRLAGEKKPDLILLDIIMPKMDGFEVLKGLKENPATKSIPVILLTNLSQKDEVKKGLELGAVDYLIKAHFMPSEVVKKIKQIISNLA